MNKRKKEIIDLSIKYLRKYGFDSFSFQDIAKELGIAKASIHYHFPSKEDLLNGVLDEIKLGLIALRSELRVVDQNTQKLKRFFEIMITLNPKEFICPISSLQAEYFVFSEEIQDKIRDISKTEIGIISEILETGRDEGEFVFTSSPEEEAKILLSSYKGFLLYSRALEKEVEDDLIERLVEKLLK
jgi:TetR/AcrR family transcriptional repressor of nem operon